MSLAQAFESGPYDLCLLSLGDIGRRALTYSALELEQGAGSPQAVMTVWEEQASVRVWEDTREAALPPPPGSPVGPMLPEAQSAQH